MGVWDLYLSLSSHYTHTHTHTCTHTHMLTRAHTCSRAHTHAHMCAHAHTYTHVHTRSCVRTHMLTRAHTCSHAHTCAHSHTCYRTHMGTPQLLSLRPGCGPCGLLRGERSPVLREVRVVGGEVRWGSSQHGIVLRAFCGESPASLSLPGCRTRP